MDKEKVTKWLDRLARAAKQVHNIDDLDETFQVIKSCTQFGKPYVQLYKGIHEIGELLGIPVTLEQVKDDIEWYSIIYKGVRFIELDDVEKYDA